MPARFVARAAAVAAILGSALGIGPSRAFAATTFTFSNGNLSWVNEPGTPTVLGCVGGKVSNGGTAIAPQVSCAAVTAITATSSPGGAAMSNVVDLRGVGATGFPNLSNTDLAGNFEGSDTIYGSYIGDRISGQGTAYGRGGGDNIAIFGGTVWGGEGNDVIQGSMGPDSLNGGPGDDILFGDSDGAWESCPGGDTYTGGSGNDQIGVVGGDVSASGGIGNDTFKVEVDCLGGVRIDGNDGSDTVISAAFRQAFNGVRVANGTAGTRPTPVQPTLPIYRYTRVEHIQVWNTASVAIVMQAGVDFVVQPSGYSLTKVDIFVPGGVWTLGDHRVDAPGLGPVTWSDYVFGPTQVRVRPA